MEIQLESIKNNVVKDVMEPVFYTWVRVFKCISKLKGKEGVFSIHLILHLPNFLNCEVCCFHCD